MLAHKIVSAVFLLLIGPLLIYIGLQGRTNMELMFHILVCLGLLLMGFYGYQFFKEMNGDLTFDNSNSILGKDNKGNHVVVDHNHNVSVIDVSGRVMAHNDDVAYNSAKQAMANNAM